MAVNIGNLVAGESEIELSYINIPALKGDKGDTGRGISSVIKTSTVGLVDTWTITYTDGSTSSFDVTNGADGDDYVITSEDYQEIADIVLDNIEIPSKTSDLENDSGFIDNTVNDLQNYYSKSETYTKQEVDGKVSSVYKYKGSVATYQDLPSTSLTIGDVYNVESTGDNYAWTGTTWDKLGGEIDLSEYYTKTQVDSALENKVDKVTGKGLSTNDFTNADKTKLDSLENYDDTEVKSDIETLEESQASQDEIIAKLKADHPDIEEEGTALSLQGTGDFDLALSPKGNIAQETTTGNQLLDIGNPDFVFKNTTYTFTNNVLSIVGTNTNYTALRYYITDLYKNNANKVLYFTFKNIDLSNYGTGNIVQLNITHNDSTPTSYVQLVNGSGTKVSHTIPADTSNVQAVEFVVCANNSSTTGNYSISITEPMLQFGTETKSYEKYTGGQASPNPSYPSPVKVVDGEYEVTVSNSDNTQSQTETIDTSPNPLYSENDLYFKAVNGDSFYDSLTSEQKANLDYGYWYVHNETGLKVLNGTENWTYYTASATNHIIYFDIPNLSYSTPNYNFKMENFKATQTACLINASGRLHFYLDSLGCYDLFPDKASWTTFLSNNNQHLYYQLATPTNTKITNTTLINSLETLQNMKAYQDQTNISQTHNEAQADMIINAQTIMSMRYLQNEIEELKQAILNS